MQTKRGYPRIQFQGHNYGFQSVRQDITIWLCTGSINKRRCTATVHTKHMGDILMMKVKNPKHICVQKLALSV